MSKRSTVLVCKSVIFYSYVDEELFFAWIQRIPIIKRFNGVGNELYLHIKSTTISDNNLLELLALFYRYKIDMKQLKIFLNDRNKEWFCGKPKGYWHRRVFEETSKGKHSENLPKGSHFNVYPVKTDQ